MRARWLVPTVLVVGILSAGGPAAAGGAWLETENQYYSPDSQVTARGTFGPGAYNGRVSDGPYNAYLVPGFRSFKKPGPVPDYAVPLGPIAIRRATGNYCCWVASLTFRVPDLPPGRYSIDYCNDPCTVNGLGDLIGGSFFVGETEEEARLMARIDRLQVKAELLRRTKQSLQRARASFAEVQEQYDQLIGRLRAARPDDSESPEAAEPADRPLSPWAVAAGLGGLILGVWCRRRAGGLAIPDYVPDTMVEEGQVPERQPMTSVGRPVMSIPAPPLTKS